MRIRSAKVATVLDLLGTVAICSVAIMIPVGMVYAGIRILLP